MSDIEGLKLFKKTGCIDIAEDASYPFRLEVVFSPPEFMQVAFITLYGGSEVVVVRGMTLEAIDQFILLNNFDRHERFRRLSVSGPSGVIREVKRER